jgi:hypothetical protein
MAIPESPEQYSRRMGGIVQTKMQALAKKREALDAEYQQLARAEAELRDICPHDETREQRATYDTTVTCDRCGATL